jgi:hypothetical protein
MRDPPHPAISYSIDAGLSRLLPRQEAKRLALIERLRG